MIVEFDEDGRIFHTVSDPVMPEVRDGMLAKGGRVLSFEPVPGPLVQEIDVNGNPIFEALQLFDENGPVLDENGQPVFKQGDPVMVPDSVIGVTCNIRTDYIVDDQITSRPSFDESIPAEIVIVADGVDTVSLTVPDPCEIRLDGETQVITGGQLDISSDMPAEYSLELVQWPYIIKRIRVTVNAAI